MHNRIAHLILLGLLSVMLAACSTPASTPPAAPTTAASGGIPSYPGATALPLPDTFKSQADALTKSVKNGKFEAYKTSDAVSKVKTTFADSFTKNGWEDKSTSLPAQTVSQLEQTGGFYLLYQKGTQVVSILSYPGTIAGPLGFKDVGASDTLFLVIAGQN